LDLTTLDDPTLIRMIALKKEPALSTLYDRYSRLVFSMALNSVGDPKTAEEITQDVFFRVWEHAGSYQSERAKVTTWITSITRNRSIDVLRKRGVRPEHHSVYWADIPLSERPVQDGAPEEAARQSYQRERVRTAMALLPEEQKDALYLAYFHGMSHRQIAEALDSPLGTVKTRIRLAMQKLRESLKDENIIVE
jgi:RNA polymerase sigma-70 factor (ECF subfamily)